MPRMPVNKPVEFPAPPELVRDVARKLMGLDGSPDAAQPERGPSFPAERGRVIRLIPRTRPAPR